MSEAASAPPTDGAASAAAKSAAPDAAKQAAKALPKQNEAFRMMGLPRLRLPSRNWMIFLGITGSWFGAVYYDKWQTRRAREKWCKLVSHIQDEPLATKALPRRVTIYLEAPPGDGLRAAREHFHSYIKPVLVAAAMDWDVVEGRKEGDVRFKTAENARKKRRRGGEGAPLDEEEYSVELVREKAGTLEYRGVAGDLVVGRHTWKEYVRGLHEGWLGPPDAPVQEQGLGKVAETGETPLPLPTEASTGDAAADMIAKEIATNAAEAQTPVTSLSDTLASAPEQTSELLPADDEAAKAAKETEEKAAEPPKPRHPPAYILPSAYPSATLSALAPELVGPATPIPFPHLLGIRNTPIRIWRFLHRRRIADSVGRQVAAAILGSYRPYQPDLGESVQTVLAHEENDWWKTTFREREAHEESVWIEECVVDERLTGRMRLFELTGDEEERAKRIGAGREGPIEIVHGDDDEE